MPRLTTQQRTKIVEFWHQTKSVKQVQRLYCEHFNVQHQPNYRTIKSTIAKFNNVGTVSNLHRGHSGRKRSGRSENAVNRVRQALDQNPQKSIRRLAAELNISRSTIHRILRHDIHAFPYKIQTESKLTDQEKQRRVDFARWFLNKLEHDQDFLKKLHMTDECHVQLSGQVNSHNFRCWGTKNPGSASTDVVPRSVLKVIMWVAVGWYGIIGPYFFEDDQGSTCTINQKNYRQMIQNFYLPQLRAQAQNRNNLIKMETQWFQQDGSPPHTARETRRFLKQHFEDRIVSLCDTIEWPPYSPDLTPPDFFLWGYLKDRIYRNPKPRTLDELKSNIRREIENIPRETFPKVMTNMTTRMQAVIERNGAYV